MHRLLSAARRRTAGVAATVVLAGGVAGGVLLTPGTAFAGTPLTTTTSITSVTQAPVPGGATVTVTVLVVPASSANGTVSGVVQVGDGPSSCDITLVPVGTGPNGAGSCSFFAAYGSYKVLATYEGVTGTFDASPSAPATLIVGSAPVFGPTFPPLTVNSGEFYSATFHAFGVPAPTYSLAPGAPSFLSINPVTGTVFGNVPTYYFAGFFTYSVVASNAVGSAVAGPFTVYIRQFAVSSLATYLSCTPRVFTGTRGRCTLYVTNTGGGFAPDVTAQIALPRELRADYCGFSFFGLGFGCSINGNTAVEDLGSLGPGQTKSLTVVFTARTGFALWGWHHGFRFTVRVVGSATSFGGFPFFGQSTSYSFAYVTIIPRGWWI